MKIASLKGVSKSFGDVQAVRDLSIEVECGEIFGLIGPNGSGKTTTMRMLMNILIPDTGEVELFGQKDLAAVRHRIGYLPEERGLYKKMRVTDTLLFFARSQGLQAREARDKIGLWLNRLSLGEWAGKKVEELSKGMQQKLQFIATVVHSPDLIIMDEPFSGMDPLATEVLKEVILDLNRKGATIVFSTHIMEQAEKLCTSLCLIKSGQPILLGRLSEIKARFGRNTVQMEYEGDLAFLRRHPMVDTLTSYENYSEIRLRDGADPADILREAIGKVTIRRFQLMEPSLHSIYLEQVGGIVHG